MPESFMEFLRRDKELHPNASVMQQSVLGAPDATAMEELRARHPLLSVSQLDPLYSMPPSLLDALSEHPDLQKWMTDDEKAFERNFAILCRRKGACGFAAEGFVSSLLVSESPLLNLGNDSANNDARDRLDPLHDSQRAYLGWLLTNPEFVAERSAIRQRREQRGLWRSFVSAPWDGGESAAEFRRFQARWVLTGMSSWELPISRGPNLTGEAWPTSAAAEQSSVRMEIPITVSLNTRYPLREQIEEARKSLVPPHLSEWIQIVQHRDTRRSGDESLGGGEGPVLYERLFAVHFYYEVVIRQRYQARLTGHIAAVDEAVGDFLGIGADRVKRLRQVIRRRLQNQT